MLIKEIKKKDIINYIDIAKKSGLTFCNSTNLYGLFDGEVLVGFTGIIFFKNKAIFKNSFVPECFRGKGYFKILFDFSLDLTKRMGIKTVEATCTYMSIREYLKRGFKIIKEYKKYKKVKNENIL